MEKRKGNKVNIDEKDMVVYCCRNGCGKALYVGDSIKYDKNYDTYCDSNWCTDGLAVWSTCLEPCWWG